MINKSFSFGDVLGFGWDVMKTNIWFFIGIFIVSFLISVLGQIIFQILVYSGLTSLFLIFALCLVSCAIEIILTIGLIKITLSFCDEVKPGFSLLFDGLDCFWRFIGAAFLYMLIISLVVAMFIVPFILLAPETGSLCLFLPVFFVAFIIGIVLQIKFGLWLYFVIDKDAGPIKALKASSRATDGAKWALFVFYLLCFLINVLGLLCFLVGLFATIPMTMVATALVYRQLCPQTPELDELGINSGSEQSIETAQVRAGIQSGLCIRVGGEEAPASEGTSAMKSVDNRGPSVDNQPPEDAGVDLSIRLSEDTSKSEYPQEGAPSEARPGEQIGYAQPVEAQPSYAQITEITPKEKKKSNKILWVVIIILSFSFIISIGALVGLGFYLRNDINVPLIPPKVEGIKGILYSDDPSVIIGEDILKEGEMIGNVKIIKINKGSVEFEKEGRRWEQKL